MHKDPSHNCAASIYAKSSCAAQRFYIVTLKCGTLIQILHHVRRVIFQPWFLAGSVICCLEMDVCKTNKWPIH